MKHINKVFYIFIMMFISTIDSSVAADAEIVNMLIPSGFLNKGEIIRYVEKSTQARISYDVYYSDLEFLRRLKKQKRNYDIIIFESVIYSYLKDQITLKKGGFSELIDDYNPVIKKKFLSENYPPNIAVYSLSLFTMIWNPHVIDIVHSDTILSVFKKAKDRTVILLDDPIQVLRLISKGLVVLCNSSKAGVNTYNRNNLNYLIKGFNSVIQEADVYITNDNPVRFLNMDFAFAMLWLGDALELICKTGYELRVNLEDEPSLSMMLIATVNNKKYVTEAANYFADQTSAKIMQNNYFHFSPYLDYSKVENKRFLNIYMRFLEKLGRIQWQSQIKGDDLRRLSVKFAELKSRVNRDSIRREIKGLEVKNETTVNFINGE